MLTQTLIPILSGKKLLIFDFDGTIADTSPLHAAAFEKVLLPFGLSVCYASIAGMTTKDAMIQCTESCGVVLEQEELNLLVMTKQKLVREMMKTQLLPLPGVDLFLRWARQHFQLSIATSGSRETVGVALERLGYIKWFDPIVCGEDVVRSKPYPDIFLRTLEITKYRSDQAIIFEDSEAGIAAARNAGVAHVQIKADTWESLLFNATRRI